MSNTESEAQGNNAEWLLGPLIESLGSVLEVMTGERPTIEAHAGEAPDDAVLWWEQELDLVPDTMLWVGASRSVWTELGRRSLAIAGVEDGSEEDFLGTYQELLQQTLSAFCQSVGAKVGREVNCLEGRIVDSAGTPGVTPCRIGYAGADEGRIFFAFQASPGSGEAQAGPSVLVEKAADQAALAEAPRPAPLPPTKTGELLLDVELPVSVSFGRAHLPLRDVLKLTSGSIVELNRTVSEPVEVIVNNCVIARGEVVVVDGNYGVRINEIISREQRLRTLN